jgi:hypothetical protein
MSAYAQYWRRPAEDRESETMLSEAAPGTSAFESSGGDASDSHTKTGIWSAFSEPASQMPGTQKYS